MDDVKITVRNEAPSDQAVAAAKTEFVVTTADGRKITLKKPGILAQFQTIGMLGDELATNRAYVGMVLPLLFVSAIDGEAVPRATTMLELEGLIQRLDEAGVAAAAMGVQKYFGAPNPEKEAAAVKN